MCNKVASFEQAEKAKNRIKEVYLYEEWWRGIAIEHDSEYGFFVSVRVDESAPDIEFSDVGGEVRVKKEIHGQAFALRNSTVGKLEKETRVRKENDRWLILYDNTRVLSDVEVPEEARAIIAGAMMTGKIKELRIDDQHLRNRAQLTIERDIFRQQTVIKLVGADRTW